MITNILDTTPAESFALLSGEMVLSWDSPGSGGSSPGGLKSVNRHLWRRRGTSAEYRRFGAADYSGRAVL
jgi:hypothetical protein